MYIPPAFRDDNRESLMATIRAARLATLVTATAEGPQATPLPLLLNESEGEHGTIYGHVAKANPQWRAPVLGDGLAIFMGPDAYVTPAWYQTKQETGKVVPTWNYLAVHAYGPIDFFEDADRLLEIVTRLTNLHEGGRPSPWSVSD
ncbi:MAG: FMN-binding negative transcriptional regulator, partial [Mesorhizobium sp.]